MQDRIRQSLGQISKKFQQRFMKGLKVTGRQAIGVSIFLHISVGLVIAGLYGDKIHSLRSNAKQQKNLKFEFVKVEDRQSNPSAIKKAGKKIGLKSSTSQTLVADKVTVNKEAVMLASLASLSQMRETFSFAIQELSADSIGAFIPIQGNAPDTKVIADGLINGYGYGGRTGIISISGGGNGDCPPRPRPKP